MNTYRFLDATTGAEIKPQTLDIFNITYARNMAQNLADTRGKDVVLHGGLANPPETYTPTIKNPYVMLQVAEAMALASKHTLAAITMLNCKHLTQRLELHNTFNPKHKPRCLDCQAWLE